jgi:predicted phosphatase
VKSIAQHFEEEVAAYNFLRRRSQIVPDILHPEKDLRARYLMAAMRVDEDERMRPKRLVFCDDSVADRDETDMFVWKELQP